MGLKIGRPTILGESAIKFAGILRPNIELVYSYESVGGRGIKELAEKYTDEESIG